MHGNERTVVLEQSEYIDSASCLCGFILAAVASSGMPFGFGVAIFVLPINHGRKAGSEL